MKRSIIVVVLTVVSAIFTGCHYKGTLAVEKARNSRIVSYDLSTPTGDKVVVSIEFPRSAASTSVQMALAYDIEVKKNYFSGAIKIQGASEFEIIETRIDVLHRQIFVTLDWSTRNLKSFYKTPLTPQFDIKESQRAVGTVILSESFLKIFSIPKHSCTGTIIGPSLILTAFHCMKSEDFCENSHFEIWDNSEWFGPGQYACANRVYVNERLDQAIFKTTADPSSYYSKGQLMGESFLFEHGTPVIVLTNNPRGSKTPKLCRVGDRIWSMQSIDTISQTIGVVSDAYSVKNCSIIPGDSGSAVMNFDGKIIGVISMANKVTSEGYFTPLSPEIDDL